MLLPDWEGNLVYTTGGSTPTAPVPPVRINEVSAANGIYVCEYFKRNDWVELYNTTDIVNMAGQHISAMPASVAAGRLTEVSVGRLRSGAYTAVITDDNGRHAVCKFIF